MSNNALNVVHLVGGDTPSTRLETLRVLYTRPELGRQRVVQVGGGRVNREGLGTIGRVTTPFGVGWLARRSLQSVIPPAARVVLHIWSPRALESVMPAAQSHRRVEAVRGAADYRLLMDVELPFDFRRLARGFSWLWSDGTLRFVYPTETVRRRLLAVGVPPDGCVLIRDSVDFAAINRASSAEVRSRLELAAADTAVLILPPVLRETGALLATWGAMLLGQVRPEVRLVVPDGGREAGRVARLIESCGMGQMLRLASRRFSLPELLTAADLAVYLPAGDAPMSSVVWALASGTPLVASAVGATTELLTHGHNAWLCRPGNPREAARRMLQALDDREQSARQATLARSEVFRSVSRRGFVEGVRRVYEDLLADRRLRNGIDGGDLLIH